MPRCQFCGHNNPASVDRCPNCGARIEQKAEEAPPPPEQTSESGTPEPDSLEGQVLSLMKAGQKIAAIKLHRQETGSGLKEAKDAVEALAAKHGIIARGAGCAGMVLLVLLAFVASGVGAWLLG
ncbi:MAG: ribosomal protein L7/L12 [Thermoguttaceae bacterium]|jgi:hypothetical protein